MGRRHRPWQTVNGTNINSLKSFRELVPGAKRASLSLTGIDVNAVGKTHEGNLTGKFYMEREQRVHFNIKSANDILS